MKPVTECKNWKCSHWNKCHRANNPDAPQADVVAVPTIFPPDIKLGEQCPYFISKTTAP